MKLGLLKAMLTDFCGDRIQLNPDRLLSIINMARDRIQRNYNLSFAKTIITTTYPTTVSVGIPMPSDFKEFPSDRSVAMYDQNKGTYVPMGGITTSQLDNNALMYGHLMDDQMMKAGNAISFYSYYLEMLTTGPVLFITPEPLAMSLRIRYSCWLAPFTENDDNAEDFLLLRGYDAVFFEALKLLNVYLKNEERIQIDEPASARAIQELTDYCGRLEHTGSAIGGY